MALLIRRRARLWLGAIAIATIAAGSAVEAQNLEFAVKASYLAKFAPFIDWPPGVLGNAGNPFRICIAGQDPFGTALDEVVRGQQVGGHPIALSRMNQIDAAAAATCNILFVGGNAAQSSSSMLDAAAGLPVLTVTDRSRGTSGGMIQFVMQDGRVRFAVDARSALGNGLQISSKLLSLAVTVKR